MSEEYHIDPKRDPGVETGIYVRAGGTSVDIGRLDTASLKAWLRSRGGQNVWAEGVVLTLLGHS